MEAEQRRKIAQLEQALRRKTYELEIAGEASMGFAFRPTPLEYVVKGDEAALGSTRAEAAA